MVSMEEQAYPKMAELLAENGLQICLKTLINALDERFNQKGTNIEGVMVLEGLKGLHKGYLRRYDFKKADHWAVRIRNGPYLRDPCGQQVGITFNANWCTGTWFDKKSSVFEFKKQATEYFNNDRYDFIVVRRGL